MGDMMDLISSLKFCCVEQALGCFLGWKCLGIKLLLSVKELTSQKNLLGSPLIILERAQLETKASHGKCAALEGKAELAGMMSGHLQRPRQVYESVLVTVTR